MFHHFQSHRFLIGSTKLLFFFFLSLSFTFFKLCSYSIATSPSVYQFLFNLLLLFFFFFLLFHSSIVARYSCLYNINCIILKLLILDTSVENLSCLFYFIPQTKSSFSISYELRVAGVIFSF